MIALYKHNVCLASKPAVICFENVVLFHVDSMPLNVCHIMDKKNPGLSTTFRHFDNVFIKKSICFLNLQLWEKKFIF